MAVSMAVPMAALRVQQMVEQKDDKLVGQRVALMDKKRAACWVLRLAATKVAE